MTIFGRILLLMVNLHDKFIQWIYKMILHDEFTRIKKFTRWIHTDSFIRWFFLPQKRFIIHCRARCGRWSVGMGFTDHYDPFSFLDDFEPNPPHHLMSKNIYFCAIWVWCVFRIAIGFCSVTIQFEIIWEISSKEIKVLLISSNLHISNLNSRFFPLRILALKPNGFSKVMKNNKKNQFVIRFFAFFVRSI